LDILEFPLTDLGNALRFVERHGQNIRYCYLWRKWLIWDDKRWREDNKGEVYSKAKEMALEMLKSATEISDNDQRERKVWHALKTQSESRIRSMINLAQSEPTIAVTPDELDRDPWLLNVENGTLDLRTAELRPHSREDLITKIIPVDYDASASCPIWTGFLQRVMGDDADLIKFLQKTVGYSLTGDATEQVMFIFYGTGANGKSTFINLILSLLGDYARQTPTETLLVKRGGGIPNDVARLKGARFVAAVESEGGRQLAETLVKQLTGGDKISARFLYGEFFEFETTFKLFLVANHKPTILGTDYAIWRRIRLIPFNVTIPSNQRDKTLAKKLEAEFAGILRWAVDGCRLWQSEGLKAPESVSAATEKYRSEMDVLADFISDRCELAQDARTPFGELYDCYAHWCEENQRERMQKNEFGKYLTERGFGSSRTKADRLRTGIKLKEQYRMTSPISDDSGDAVPRFPS
jgi:putative DNA primase/helicase